MEETAERKVAEYLLEDYRKVQEDLVRRAIAEWDLYGEGYFHVWIQERVYGLWCEWTELN